MRLSLALSLGALTASMVSFLACGGTDVQQQGKENSGGSGGTGGAASVATASSSSSATASSTGGTSHTATASSSSTGGDPGMVSDVYPAKHDPAPTVVKELGPVLQAPNLIPVFFMGDDPNIDTQLTQFVDTIGTGNYWSAVVSEYGIGPATAQPPIMLSEAAPTNTSDSAIQTWLKGKLADPMSGFPAHTKNDLYVLFYPDGTSITLQGTQSCVDFGGYHNDTKLDDGTLAAYAVVPRCSDFDGFTGIDAVTAGGSHEIIEGVTDPYPQDNPAYDQPDINHFYWEFALGGGEVGDMCAQNPGAFQTFPDVGFVVQRTWSNKAAKASHDPCVPYVMGAGPYYNSVPHMVDDISIMGATLKGVSIPVGGSKTVEVDLFSDGDTGGPWSVFALDGNQLMGGSPQLSFSWNKTTGQNGEKLYLTITVEQASNFNAELFYVFSSLSGNPNDGNLWVGFVGN